MEAHQSFVSPLKQSVVVRDPENIKNSSISSGDVVGFQRKEAGELGDAIGVLEVYIHQARDIHNICIYHKQDVYAKVSLTSDPADTVSTRIINGGGKNPVFNENLRLNVRTLESSVKCEIWMLSRVKNYLQDQLLGFALVPLLDVLVGNGKLSQEFSLSSSDLFHSPAGFVQLSLSYNGSMPEVLEIPRPHQHQSHSDLQDSEIPDSIPSDYDKIEFPDPEIVNENQKMVSEYFGIPCNPLDSKTRECLNTSDADEHLNSDLGVKVVESFSASNFESVSFLTNGSPSASNTVSSQSCNTPPGTSNLDLVSPRIKDKDGDSTEAESKSSSVAPSKSFGRSVLKVSIEPEQEVIQQEIVDIYKKSMQQFTEALAKMKLPMDVEKSSKDSGNTNSDSGNTNSSSDQKSQASKANGSKVFYGSRAFF